MAVLCVCRHCSQLFCISSEPILGDGRKDSDPSKLRTSRRFTVTNGPPDPTLASIFNDFESNGADTARNLFPICHSCYSNALFQLDTLIDHYRRATAMLKSLGDVQSKILFSEIENRIAEPLPTPKTSSIPKSSSRRTIAPAAPRPEQAKREIELIDVKIPRVKLVMPSVFHIGFDHLYGTLNGSRIGFFRGGGLNERVECNAALKMVAHLVWSTAHSFDVECETLVLPNGVIRYKGQQLKLKIPKLIDSHAVKQVDLATEGLFHACRAIFAAPGLVEFCSMAPFLIDTDRKMIEQVGYEFDTKNLEKWSIALKHLLFNFKVIQNRGFDRLQT